MIEINGEDWEIAMVSPFSPGLMNPDGTYALGCCDDYLKIIFINNKLNKELTKKVLCHELTHAAMFSYDIQLDLMEEERLADVIATYGQDIVNMTNQIFKDLKKRKGN